MQGVVASRPLQRLSPQKIDSPEAFYEEEGFAEEEAESLIVPKHEVLDDFSATKTVQHKSKIKYREPKLKLTFLAKDNNSGEQLRRAIVRKQQRSFNGRSLDLSKRESRQLVQNDLIGDCVAKIKRTIVGDNITIPIFSLTDSKAVKAFIMASGCSLTYESPKEINTHGFLRTLTDIDAHSFLEWEPNQLLKNRLRDSFIMPKKNSKACPQPKPIQFTSEFESGNLQFAAQTAEGVFELYLKNDTNTHGHQSWFYFRVRCNRPQTSVLPIAICNLKRDLKLFQDGQRIFSRKIDQKGTPSEQWKPDGANFQNRCNMNAKFTNSRVYRLNFDLTVQSGQWYEIALLPGYSYSELLRQVAQLQESPHVQVECLTYSLIGLAIPVLTFTSPGDSSMKNVTLINCRIHPGETNSSFMARGLMKALASQQPNIKEFLDRNIIKIIPMLNPDGVVFGNFRTNFLGIDLNRSFDNEDEVTNPQIVALKELGYRMQEQYGTRFSLFLDLHGHSSDKNIFSYGPDYDSSETNFYQIRLLPKILSNRSRFFKYPSCTFKLEDYKRHTARGFFLNTLSINAYTIESSYAFFVDQGKNQPMGWGQWVKFGQDLAESLVFLFKLNRLSSIRNRSEMKKALGDADKQQMEIIRKFKKQFKKEKEEEVVGNVKKEVKKVGGQDSDGENECEDYNRNQREEIVRRVVQNSAPSMILPRVLKPSIVYPTVTPKLFKIREQFEVTHLKILYTKRSNKYSGLRMHGNNYIHSLKGIQLIKPEAKNIFH